MKVKILFIGYGTNLGGIESFIYNLIKTADKDKFDFSILSFNWNKPIVFFDDLITMGVHIYTIPFRKEYLSYLKGLKKVFIENDFDIIHFNLMDLGAFERVIYASKYSKAKMIVHSHNGGYSNKFSKANINHIIGTKFLKGIKYERVACGKKAGKFMFDGKEFIVFNNGINVEKFQYNVHLRHEIRNEIGINEDTFLFGLIAAFLPVKNHKFIVNLFKEYLKYDLNSKMVLVGEGSQMNQIRKLVDELKLNDKIIFLGKRLDVYKIYSAFDIYVMPSLSEGLSISLCEAQINGLKCYTSDGVDKDSNITGNVEFLSLNKTPKEWAEYIFNQNNKRDIDVLEKIPEEFDSRKSYRKIYDFYEEMLNE